MYIIFYNCTPAHNYLRGWVINSYSLYRHWCTYKSQKKSYFSLLIIKSKNSIITCCLSVKPLSHSQNLLHNHFVSSVKDPFSLPSDNVFKAKLMYKWSSYVPMLMYSCWRRKHALLTCPHATNILNWAYLSLYFNRVDKLTPHNKDNLIILDCMMVMIDSST